MSPAYPHLLLNHLPVDGVLVATVLLGVALWRRSREAALFGYWTFVIVAVLAILTFVSGNFAPPALAGIAGISQHAITVHQVVGFIAMTLSVLVGLLASIPLVLTDIAGRRGVVIAYLVAALVLDAIFIAAAATGGIIRHTELR